jgi:hypothetical protein
MTRKEEIMSTPEEIAELIERDHPKEARLASKFQSVLTKVLESTGNSNDPVFRAKVVRALIVMRVGRKTE